ncbi:DUF642 domain-containing protein [Streptomyces olivaceoviridis]
MATELRNASFSDPPLTSEPFVQFTPDGGGRPLPGWKVTQGVVEVVRLPSGDAADGAAQALRLKNSKRAQDRDVGGVSQTIATVPGERVTISWKERAEPGVDSTPNEQRYTVLVKPVSGTSSTLQKHFDPDLGRDKGWVTRSVEFTAQSPTTTVSFIAYKTGARSALVTGVTVASQGGGEVSSQPELFATASPAVVSAKPGETVTVAFSVGNRGPVPVRGEKVVVTLTPYPPLVPAQNTPATVSFPGRQLTAGQPALGGEFQVTVPADAASGTYTVQAVVTHDGIALKEPLAWQIQVTAQESGKPAVNAHQLVIFQVTSEPTANDGMPLFHMFMTDAPKWPSASPGEGGQDSLLCIGIATLDPGADLLGLPQEFKAPTGFVFTDVAAFGHFRTVRSWAAVSPKWRLTLRRSEDNTLAWVTGSEKGEIPAPHLDPALFTDPARALTHDQTFLGYGFSMAARPDARPGLYTDGYAKFGSKEIKLIGRIT